MAKTPGNSNYSLKRARPYQPAVEEWDRLSIKHVPCKHCGQETNATGLRECLGCWSLRIRVQADPELAKKILADMEKETL